MIETRSVFTGVAQRGSHLRNEEQRSVSAQSTVLPVFGHELAVVQQEERTMSTARRALLRRVAQLSERDTLGADGFAQAAHSILGAQAAIRAEILEAQPEGLEMLGLRDRINSVVIALASDERSMAEAFADLGTWAWHQGMASDALLELLASVRIAASRMLIAGGASAETVRVLERRCAYGVQAARDGYQAVLRDAADEAHLLLAQASKQLDAVETLAQEILSILRLLRTNEDSPWARDEGTMAMTHQAESLLEDLAKVLA